MIGFMTTVPKAGFLNLSDSLICPRKSMTTMDSHRWTVARTFLVLKGTSCKQTAFVRGA